VLQYRAAVPLTGSVGSVVQQQWCGSVLCHVMQLCGRVVGIVCSRQLGLADFRVTAGV
jgi:hypothetical protein